jgi:hypothetical protein
MRRLLSIGLAVAVLSLALAASGTGYENYKDKFTSIGWDGSDGSLPWSGPWSEIGDDGDAMQGNVQVVSSGNCASGNCMRIAGLTLLTDIGAERTADTSILEEVSLSYDLKNVVTGINLGLTQLLVQVRGDEGWATVDAYDLGSDFSGYYTHDDLDGFGSESFGIRFVVSGLAMASEVYIDNIEVKGTPVEDSTTTTTTTTETTTTVATTTTTKPPTTTTTKPPSTTTTEPATSPPTTTATTSTTTADRDGGPTSNGTESSTTTTVPVTAEGPGSGSPPDGSGIRAAARGLQASFQGDLFGDGRTVSVSGVDLQADYNMAVEVIEASWAWMVILGLLIAWSIVSGLDRRRGQVDL